MAVVVQAKTSSKAALGSCIYVPRSSAVCHLNLASGLIPSAKQDGLEPHLVARPLGKRCATWWVGVPNMRSWQCHLPPHY